MDVGLRHLVIHRLHGQRAGNEDLRFGLRLAAAGGFAVAQVVLGVLVFPGGGVDVHLEGPDHIQLLLRAPVDLDLPRVRAGVADRPEVVLLLAAAVLVDVNLVVLALVRDAARHHREELVGVETAREGPQLVADADVDLGLGRLQHVHQLVGEHHALVQRLVQAGIDDQEGAVGALERLQLRAVQAHVAVAVAHLVIAAVLVGVLLVAGILLPDADLVGTVEVDFVVGAELDGRAGVLERLEGVGPGRGGPLVGPVEAHGAFRRRGRDHEGLGLRRAALQLPFDLDRSRLGGDDHPREVDPDRPPAGVRSDHRFRSVPVRRRVKRFAEELVRGHRRDRRADRGTEGRGLIHADKLRYRAELDIRPGGDVHGAVRRPIDAGTGAERDGVLVDAAVRALRIDRVPPIRTEIVRGTVGESGEDRRAPDQPQVKSIHKILLSFMGNDPPRRYPLTIIEHRKGRRCGCRGAEPQQLLMMNTLAKG